MIDTIGFFVPISQKSYNLLASSSVLTQRVSQIGGEIHFEYHNIDVEFPSWAYNVMVSLDDKKWVPSDFRGKKILAGGFPHLRLEFSVPKILYGHNLCSVSLLDIEFACEKVKAAFLTLTGCHLPCVGDWFVYRADLCANFVLPSEAAVFAYINYLKGVDYPRRSPILYDTAIYFASRVATFKIYAKGQEFKKHDYRRLLNVLGSKVVDELRDKSKFILRFEVELKRRLQYIVKNSSVLNVWNGYPCLSDLLNKFNLCDEFNRIVNNFLCGLEKKTMKLIEVRRRLTLHGSSAAALYGMYVELLTTGKKRTRRNYSKNMFYRYMRVYRNLGIPLVSNDLRRLDVSHAFPADFSIEIDVNNSYYQYPVRFLNVA